MSEKKYYLLLWLLYISTFIFYPSLSIFLSVAILTSLFKYDFSQGKSLDWHLPEVASVICFASMGFFDSKTLGLDLFGSQIFASTETRKILLVSCSVTILPAVVYFKIMSNKMEKSAQDAVEELKKIKEIMKPNDSYKKWVDHLALFLFRKLTVPSEGQSRLTLYVFKENGSRIFVPLGRYSADATMKRIRRTSIGFEGILKKIHTQGMEMNFVVPGKFWEDVENLTKWNASRFIKKYSGTFPLPENVIELKDYRMRSNFYCGGPLKLNENLVGLVLYESDVRPDTASRKMILKNMGDLIRDPSIQVLDIVLANWFKFYDIENSNGEETSI